jgi:hypothetical protein
VPVVPITILLAQRTWRGFADLLSEKAGPRISHAAIAVLAILLISFGGRASQQSLRVEFRHGRDSIGLSREYATNWSAIAAQITAMSEPGDTIAISAAGIIPYYSNLYTIDQLGLVASDLSRYTKRADPHPGHSLLLAGDILMEHPPQFLIGHPTVNRNRDSIDIIQRVSAEWFERQVPVYRTCVVQIADSPPLYTMFALRQDVSERFPQQPPLNGPE